MVFVPVSRADAVALRDGGGSARLVGHAATPALLHAHGYDEATREDADYAALCYAGARSVVEPTADPLRLVLAAELEPAAVEVDPGDPYGQVLVRLHWSAVQALFADEPSAAPAVAAARTAAQGVGFEQALELAAVEELDAGHDLLWFAPEELDHLP